MDDSSNPLHPSQADEQTAAAQRLQFAAATIVLALLYALLWFLRAPYKGIDDDGMLYALQAMARAMPELAANDLFLKYGSQDSYSIFSPAFAWLIQRIGMAPAGALLVFVFQLWTAVAAWWIARQLTSSRLAWLAIGVVLMIPGEYGAFNVFQYSETFLTARLPAEALVLSAIALLLAARVALAAIAVFLAFLIHPLMGVPGIVVLALLRFPKLLQARVILLLALSGIALSLVATWASVPGFLPFDDSWLHVIRERSYYVFADSWRPVDWDLNLIGLISLLCWHRASTNDSIKKLAAASIATGAVGLALTAFTSYVTPIEIMVKGQPWRWLWISSYMAILMMPLVVVSSWASLKAASRAGLVISSAAWIVPIAWAFPIPLASLLGLLGWVLVARGGQVPEKWTGYAWIFAIGTSILLVGTVVASSVAFLQLEFTTNREPWAIERARDLLGLAVPGLILAILAWYVAVAGRRIVPTAFMAAFTIAALIAAVPHFAANWSASRYGAAYSSFAAWRDELDHRRSVFWPYEPTAVWFLLDSPSYLSTGQTAGVMFSRETALEAKRRAAWLKPVNGHDEFAIGGESFRFVGELSLASLRAICSDPELGYVVSTQDLGVTHLNAPEGRWSKWKLYSCDRVGA